MGDLGKHHQSEIDALKNRIQELEAQAVERVTIQMFEHEIRRVDGSVAELSNEISELQTMGRVKKYGVARGDEVLYKDGGQRLSGVAAKDDVLYKDAGQAIAGAALKVMADNALKRTSSKVNLTPIDKPIQAVLRPATPVPYVVPAGAGSSTQAAKPAKEVSHDNIYYVSPMDVDGSPHNTPGTILWSPPRVVSDLVQLGKRSPRGDTERQFIKKIRRGKHADPIVNSRDAHPPPHDIQGPALASVDLQPIKRLTRGNHAGPDDDTEDTTQPMYVSPGAERKQEFIMNLQNLDCRDIDALVSLGKQLADRHSIMEFSMCGYATENETHQLYLKVGGVSHQFHVGSRTDFKVSNSGMGRQYGAINPGTMQSAADTATAAATWVLECVPVGKGVGSTRVPEFVVCLGEVVQYSQPKGETVTFDKIAATNYFVLMDVTTRSKALWMAFCHDLKAAGRGDGRVPGKRMPLKTWRHIDLVCLLQDVRDWKPDAVEPMLRVTLPDLLKDGKRDIKPQFTNPILADMKHRINECWDAAPQFPMT
jgi:hypothetical protein